MKLVVVVVFILALLGCVNSKVEHPSGLVSRLIPIHPKQNITAEANYLKKYVSMLVDNDGNQYVTWWVGNGEFDSRRFLEIEIKCKNSNITHASNLSKNIPDLYVNKTGVMFYKTVSECILKNGYTIDKSEAYYPDGFYIEVRKSYESHGERVGANGFIQIYGNRLTYAKMIPDVKKCYKKASLNYSEGMFSGYIYVSVGGVLDAYLSCLTDLGYNAKLSK